MNPEKEPYKGFALCQDMWDSLQVFRSYDPACTAPFVEVLQNGAFEGVFLTGEGSSRIFPAKRAIYEALRQGPGLPVSRRAGKSQGPEKLERPENPEPPQKHSFLPLYTEGATQALEYRLETCAVFGASNSGRTKEVVRLFQTLRQRGHLHLYGITAHGGSPLEELSHRTYVLGCGAEGAVAATKSVMEQALFYQALFGELKKQTIVSEPKAQPLFGAVPKAVGEKRAGIGSGTVGLRKAQRSPETAGEKGVRFGSGTAALREAANMLEHVLSMELDPEVVRKLAQAETLYFAGRNNGVAEELALKTNEITRKKSDFLEGTYAVHGIEEVLNPGDAVVLIDPFPQEEEKFHEVLVKGVGTYVCAIASRFTTFPTILIPEGGPFRNYLELAAGWNILVEIGLRLRIDLDKPVRARKVGNEAKSESRAAFSMNVGAD